MNGKRAKTNACEISWCWHCTFAFTAVDTLSQIFFYLRFNISSLDMCANNFASTFFRPFHFNCRTLLHCNFVSGQKPGNSFHFHCENNNFSHTSCTFCRGGRFFFPSRASVKWILLAERVCLWWQNKCDKQIHTWHNAFCFHCANKMRKKMQFQRKSMKHARITLANCWQSSLSTKIIF